MSNLMSHKTSNLYEAAYLLAKGFKIIGKEHAGSKAILILDGDGIDDAVLKFYDDGLVKARLYSENFKKIKDYIFTSH